ncbi:MAG: Stf0 family sulfotransferase [Granulosicoccus sp.]
MSHYQSYILCTSPRSGSTLLCRLLAATGKSGIPDSHFHSPSISDWMRYYDIDADNTKTEHDLLSEIFQAARFRGTGNTGMFGLRMQRQSFGYFIKKLCVLINCCSSDSERIQTLFGRTQFIHLTRENKLEQAISYVKASQTGLWHQARDGTELERLSARKSPYYSADEIERKLKDFTDMDEGWESWFVDEGLNPLRICYEDLSNDPLGVTGQLLEYLGLNRKLSIGLELPVAKLADETNSYWASRFRSDNRI